MANGLRVKIHIHAKDAFPAVRSFGLGSVLTDTSDPCTAKCSGLLLDHDHVTGGRRSDRLAVAAFRIGRRAFAGGGHQQGRRIGEIGKAAYLRPSVGRVFWPIPLLYCSWRNPRTCRRANRRRALVRGYQDRVRDDPYYGHPGCDRRWAATATFGYLNDTADRRGATDRRWFDNSAASTRLAPGLRALIGRTSR